jgi:hypothetical protein
MASGGPVEPQAGGVRAALQAMQAQVRAGELEQVRARGGGRACMHGRAAE